MAAPAAPAPLRLTTLARRADFVAAARARRQSRPGLTLQARRRDAGRGPDGIRVGYTCSKKVGNAVARNRAKRRLRAAARAVLPRARASGLGLRADRPARRSTAARPFAALCDDLASALAAVHGRQA